MRITSEKQWLPNGHALKRDGEENPPPQYGDMRYPRRNTSVVTQEAINIIIRGGALRGNCVYYPRHTRVENEMRGEDFVESADPDLEVGTSSSSAPDNGDSDAHNTKWRQTHLPVKDRPLAPPSTFEN